MSKKVTFKSINEIDNASEVNVGLVRQGGTLYLSAVDTDGNALPQGNLFRFGTTGRVYRCKDVNPNLGLRLNAKGQVSNGKARATV